jgi:tetratricopeptide (TPR) repeat protein
MRADEHPEALIDRAQQGALTPQEQASLQRHLDECAVCALQISLAPRFERELAPQSRDALLSERAVERALESLQGAARLNRMRRPPRWSRWAAAALLVFGVTAVAAVIRRGIGPRPPAPPPTPAVQPRTPAAASRPVEPPAPVEAPPVPESPPPAAAARSAVRATPITADALFERAEKLRRDGRAEAAIATYRRLQATFPETAEARLSFALAGQLLLERRHPGDALAQFDRHLSAARRAGEGEVGEEVLAGRATALEQLHRDADAIAAWKTLLARYPRSVYAGRARARLEQLTRQP